jgi:hypothetical protein
MTRRIMPRLLAAGATVAALVAVLTAIAGTGLAETTAAPTAAQAQYGPSNTAAPTIGGTPQTGQTLTASPGKWTGSPTFSYAWQRCNAQGASCAAISGATAQTYAVQTADVGSTLRVAVTAKDASGSTTATSSQTAVVTQAGPEGAIKLSNGETSIPASSVSLPQRLIIDGVKFAPNVLTTRGAFVGRFHVSDTRGFVVRDTLVKVTALPYAWAFSRGEVRTDQTGWATVTIQPTRSMPLVRRHALVMFVRARADGQPLLAGSSSRRLVQITIR